MGGRWLILLTTATLMVSALGSALATGVLNGGVREDVYKDSTPATGYVYQAETGRPVSDATVSLPDRGLWTRTGARGEFVLPPLPPGHRGILNVSKPGFVPENAVLEGWTGGSNPLKLGIRTLGAGMVLDPGLHHLGDDRYSPYSAGAGQFHRKSEGPVLIRQFSLDGRRPPGEPVLEIGAVIGLDTPQAQRARQSRLNSASSPTLVRLNGYTVGQIAVNGLRHSIPLPPALLSPGLNTLEVEAGYHRPDGVRVDYDDLELMTILLTF